MTTTIHLTGRRIRNTNSFGEYVVQAIEPATNEAMLYNFLTHQFTPFVLSRILDGLRNGNRHYMDKEKTK